jgi:uncharacterized protein (DUF983 family)
MKPLYEKLMRLLGRRCPKCGGKQREVYDWEKVECEDCHYTYKKYKL